MQHHRAGNDHEQRDDADEHANHVAANATTLFNKTDRLTISARSAPCTSAATPSTTIVAMRVARTIAREGPRAARPPAARRLDVVDQSPPGMTAARVGPRAACGGAAAGRAVARDPAITGRAIAAASPARWVPSTAPSDRRSTPRQAQVPTAQAASRGTAGTTPVGDRARSTAFRTGNTPESFRSSRARDHPTSLAAAGQMTPVAPSSVTTGRPAPAQANMPPDTFTGV